jgi:hypothetical protein
MLRAFFLVGALFLFAFDASATDLIRASCEVQKDHTTNCNIRSMVAGKTITSKIDARIAGREKSVGALRRMSASSAENPEEIAVLFLVDGSKSMTQDAIEAIKADIATWVDAAEPVFVFGVASFGTELKWLADIGSDKGAVLEGAEELDREENNTALYEVTLKAIDRIQSRGAGRSFVVLMSDGLAEDNAIPPPSVQEAANSHGVAIFSIGYPTAKPKDGVTPHQPLRLLAEKSGGVFFKAEPDGSLAESASKQLMRLFDNGGVVNIDTSDESEKDTLELLVTMSDGSLASAEQKLRFTAPLSTMKKLIAYWNGGVQNQLFIVGGGLGLLLLLIALLVLLMRPRRGSSTSTTAGLAETESDETTLADNSGLIYGYLDLLDGVGPPRREPITSTSFRIGRAPTNNLVLDNSTVSNDHAVLTIDQDNSFEIRDVHSANGTQVNGEEVGRALLSDGDRIEIGRVSMRLVLSG